VKKFDGSKITSEGFEFSGSIRQIYWHSIEPFIEPLFSFPFLGKWQILTLYGFPLMLCLCVVLCIF
jgi:hypothetical protein